MIYFDYAATTPLDRDALDIYAKTATEYFGNASSLHDIGSIAHDLLESCRQSFSDMLSVPAEGIYFTSGGSESNFLCLQALISAKKSGKHIVTSSAEHSSIHSTLEQFKRNGYEITALPLTEDGIVDIQKVKEATREDTILIAIQHGNSEIGSIQPIEEIAVWCKQQNIFLHSDCVHTFGKIDIKSITRHVDSLSLSSHKFYGPKGVGLAYINPYISYEPFYPSATHEQGFRPGTVNIPGIAAMTVAAQKMVHLQTETYQKASLLRERLLAILKENNVQATFYSAPDGMQLPHTLGLRFHKMEGQWVMLECNRHGFAISTGSACSVRSSSISKTMKSMNVGEKEAKEFIRISFGHDTTLKDVEALADRLLNIVQQKY